VFYVKKGKCFPFLIKRKTLSYDESFFFLLTGINFPLTNFLYGYQTWKNEKNGFQEFVFLETNKGLEWVCFLESDFQETIFQTFLCLFVIRKVGQRKTLFSQWKTLSGQRKIWLGFQESVFLLFWAENTFQKLWKI
jgi:hypothetical protein